MVSSSTFEFARYPVPLDAAGLRNPRGKTKRFQFRHLALIILHSSALLSHYIVVATWRLIAATASGFGSVVDCGVSRNERACARGKISDQIPLRTIGARCVSPGAQPHGHELLAPFLVVSSANDSALEGRFSTTRDTAVDFAC